MANKPNGDMPLRELRSDTAGYRTLDLWKGGNEHIRLMAPSVQHPERGSKTSSKRNERLRLTHGGPKRRSKHKAIDSFSFLDTGGELVAKVGPTTVRVDKRFEHILKRQLHLNPAILEFTVVAYDGETDSYSVAPTKPKGRIGRFGFRAPKRDKTTVHAKMRKTRPPALSWAYRSATLAEAGDRAESAPGPQPTMDNGVELDDDIARAAKGFISSGDAHVVLGLVHEADAEGQPGRISCLADILHDIDVRVGGERAIDFYKRLLPATEAIEFGEVKPIVLQEIAKLAQRLGQRERAASYALGAARNALENGEHVIAGNLLRQSKSLEIL